MAAVKLVMIAVTSCIVMSATVYTADSDVICPKKYQEGREIEIKASIHLSEDIGEEVTEHENPMFNLKLSSGGFESIICNKSSNLGVCNCIKVQENVLNCSLVLPDNRAKYEGAEVTFRYYSSLSTNGQSTEADISCRITYDASSGADGDTSGQTSGGVFQVVIIIIRIALSFLPWLFC